STASSSSGPSAAARGTATKKSSRCVRPRAASCTSRKPPPPGPVSGLSHTQDTAAAATHASTALPPSRSTRAPASAVSGCPAAIAPGMLGAYSRPPATSTRARAAPRGAGPRPSSLVEAAAAPRYRLGCMRRTAALAAACLLALAAAEGARAGGSSEFSGHHRQLFRVVVVDGLSTADLPRLAQSGAAVGLLVPNAGPRTSAGYALAGMVRGILYNARLPKPTDSILIRVEHARTPPRHGPAIVLALPPQHAVPN